MLKIKTTLLIAVAALGLGTIATPASGFDGYVEFYVSNENLQAGQAAVFVAEIMDCESAPTSFDLMIVTQSGEVHISESYKGYKLKKHGTSYIATWVYKGVNNSGVQVGWMEASLVASGGCVGVEDEIGYVDELFVLNPATLQSEREVRVVAMPGENKIKVYWNKAVGAQEYNLRYADHGTENFIYEYGISVNNFEISASADVSPGDEQDIQVQPVFESGQGEWSNNLYGTAALGQSHVWTSVVGDNSKTPVTEFNSINEVQFNLEIPYCADPGSISSGDSIVNVVWRGGIDGGDTDDINWGFNEWATQSGSITNFASNIDGNKVIFSWRGSFDIGQGVYSYGNYFTYGCGETFADLDGSYPTGEYSEFKIVSEGKNSPIITELDFNAKATKSSLKFTWESPNNVDDGPFTYEVIHVGNWGDPNTYETLVTTTSNRATIKGLNPGANYEYLLRVSNSIGSNETYIEGTTTQLKVKVGSKLNKTKWLKLFTIPKPSQGKAKISKRNYFESIQACTIKRGIIYFSKSIGVCALKATWKVQGKTKTKSVEIWSRK